jgi:hypothetical protein
MSAAHALRHAARPWVGLCALSVAALTLIDPALGCAVAVSVLVAGILAPGTPSVSGRVLAAVTLAVLPGVFLLATHGSRLQPVPDAADEVDGMGVLLRSALPLGLALGLVLGLVGTRGGKLVPPSSAPGPSGRRTILVLLWAAVIASTAAPFTGREFALRQDDFLRMAALPAGILAAGGLLALLRGPAIARLLGVLACGGLILGSAVNLRLGLATTYAAGSRPPSFGSRNRPDVAAAYAWLSAAESPQMLDAVLVRWVDQLEDHLGRNSAPHEGPLLCGLPLYCDWSGQYARDPEHRRLRHDRVRRLFSFDLSGEPEQEWDPRTFSDLDGAGLDGRARPLVVLVEAADRNRARGRLAQRLPLLGCRLLERVGEVELWLRPGAREETQGGSGDLTR